VFSHDGDFAKLMARVRAGDEVAETVVFRRYVRRLIALAAKQFDAHLRDQADVENVVLSAYKSFFLRHRRDEFDLDGWDSLWSLLVVITLHKCSHRRNHIRADRRDVRRVVHSVGRDGRAPWLTDRAPTPVESAMLTETVEQLLSSMDSADRGIVEQILAGYTANEIAERLDCSERTVRRVRQRAKLRLERSIAAENGVSETDP
jgi:RNA polymerase sigma factor (sigma-70 family)